MDERDWNDVLGVSSIVRFRRQFLDFPSGTMAMVTAQAPAGRSRCHVMVPGRALTYSPLVSDLEVVQGHELDWWKRKTRPELHELQERVRALQATQDDPVAAADRVNQTDVSDGEAYDDAWEDLWAVRIALKP